MRRGDKELLLDILEACERIESYTQGLNYEDFLNNIEKQDAVIRNIEIIGEASKNISNDLKNRYRSVEWRKISGMRNKLIHEYFGIDVEIVWLVVKEEIPTLKRTVMKILEEMFGYPGR